MFLESIVAIITLGLPLAAVTSFTITSILIELTPGPNMSYLALVAASEGRRYGFATVLGVALGLAIIGTAAALGVTPVIQSSDFLYQSLRWSGIAFLLYLAWDGWRDQKSTEKAQESLRMVTFFQRGLLTNLLNPKAAAFYITVLPTFLPFDASLSQWLLLSGIYVGVATPIHAMIVVLAGSLMPILKDEARERVARRVLSLLLACVAIWFAFGTAR